MISLDTIYYNDILDGKYDAVGIEAFDDGLLFRSRYFRNIDGDWEDTKGNLMTTYEMFGSICEEVIDLKHDNWEPRIVLFKNDKVKKVIPLRARKTSAPQRKTHRDMVGATINKNIRGMF